jgi:hypothetical protein
MKDSPLRDRALNSTVSPSGDSTKYAMTKALLQICHKLPEDILARVLAAATAELKQLQRH